MAKETLTQVPKQHHLNTLRMITLRDELIREMAGFKNSPPTAYIRVKQEFNLSGSRKHVLEKLTKLLEERLNVVS